MDFWTREVVNTYQTVLNNIYISEGDVLDRHAINFLQEIELEDNLKLHASVWEADDNGKMVHTKDGKVVVSKEPLTTLMRPLGNQLDPTIFTLIQHGTPTSLADAQNLVHQHVLTKINGDRPYFEARGSWKKVKSDFDYDGPWKLANLSLMWEKMISYRQGMILECNRELLVKW